MRTKDFGANSTGHFNRGAVRRRGRWALPELLEPRQLLSAYTVNTLSDATTPVAGLLTLRQAVAAANAHAGADSISFAASLFSTSGQKTLTLAHGEIDFTDTSGATTVTGPGSASLAIDGNHTSRIFGVAAKTTVTLTGLTLSAGKAPRTPTSTSYLYFGGAIDNNGSLTISASTLSGNTAADPINTEADFENVYGGAVYSRGPLVLQVDTFSNNSAQADGESAGKGGAVDCIGSLTVSGCSFTDNFVHGTYDEFAAHDGNALGGAIYAGGPLSVTASTLTGDFALNTAPYEANYGGTGEGGGIYAASTATVVSTTITGCSATGGTAHYGDNGTGGGGGIAAVGKLTITSSTISHNTVMSGAAEALSATDPNAPATGGGILSLGGLTLTDSTVSGNTATGGTAAHVMQKNPPLGSDALGGGIYVAGPLIVSQSTLSGNKAMGGTGNEGVFSPGPYYASDGGDGEGGGIFIAGTATSAKITDSTVANNTATGGTGGDIIRGAPTGSGAGNGGNGIGGGIDSNAPLKILDSTITGNAATAGAGGAGYAGVSYTDPPVPPLPPGKSGSATSGGLLIAAGSAILDNSIFSANKAVAAFSDITGTASASSSNDLVGVGGGLTNGTNGDKVGVTNPKLSALGNYGGPTQTMYPLTGSLALDAGNNGLIPAGLTVDQRGLPRIVNARVDIGAVEFSQIVITGSVYNDINGDGIRQKTDPGMANIQVYVDLTDSGVFATGDPVATTNSSGNYTLTFSPLTVGGSLIVREVRPTTMRRTEPAGLYPLGFYTINSSAGTASNITFGNSLTSQILGTVYKDTNANGKQDPGEPGLAGWTVEVDTLVSGVWQDNKFSTTTDTNGDYSLILAAGTYRIHAVVKAGYTPTKPLAVGYTLSLAAGATVTGENFGNK